MFLGGGEALGTLASWPPDGMRGVSPCSPLLRATLCQSTDPVSSHGVFILLSPSPGWEALSSGVTIHPLSGFFGLAQTWSSEMLRKC